jgi:hypothetical protein
MSGGEDESDLTADIFETNIYEAPRAPKRDFLPWHRPRKQFVRRKQWCAQVTTLLGALTSAGQKLQTLKYFGLPGDDLLDIRDLWSEVCLPNKLGLHFLGLNSAAQPQSERQVELNISLHEIKALNGIDPESQIIPDDLRLMSNGNSIVFNRAKQAGPFDIINVDLCDGFGSESAERSKGTYYDAIAQLLGIQARHKSPWLLFLTTRVGKNHIDREALEKFIAKYENNLETCEAFKEFSAKTFAIGDGVSLASAASDDLGLQRIFLVGVCKWLLSMTMTQQPPSKIEVKSILGYGVDVQDDDLLDLISIAVCIHPQHAPAQDASNLAKTSANPIDECATATKVIQRVAKTGNVDAILRNAPAIRKDMFEQMQGLLSAARYDVAKYAEWEESFGT